MTKPLDPQIPQTPFYFIQGLKRLAADLRELRPGRIVPPLRGERLSDTLRLIQEQYILSQRNPERESERVEGRK